MGGPRALTNVSPPVFLRKAQSSSSASVLHVGLAEDLHIWVMLVVGDGTGGVGPLFFLSSWASYPVKEPIL